MNNILLTGATGFVGKNFTAYAKNNKNLFVNPISLRGSISELKMEGITAVIHLAGKAHDLKNTANAQEYFDVNCGKTIELFDLFLKSQCRDFIYFSSVKAVADTVDHVLFEDVEANPKTPYGQSKQQAEGYILKQQLPEGKRVFILRPCMIHGPGNKGNLNLLYKVVDKGVPYPLGAFNNKRSFLSIENLLYVLERIIQEFEIPGGVYNIADDQSLSTTEVIKIIGEATHSQPRIWNVSTNLITVLARIGDKLSLPLNSERLKKLTESYVVSNEKLKKALSIKELPVSSRSGLLKTIISFRTK
jgi:nucleoside-diphosphate-sugar epimerase